IPVGRIWQRTGQRERPGSGEPARHDVQGEATGDPVQRVVLPPGQRGCPVAQTRGAFLRLVEGPRPAARHRRSAYPATELRALPRDRAAHGGGRMNPVLRDSLEVFFGRKYGLPAYVYLLLFLALVEFLALCAPFLGAQMWSGSGHLVRIVTSLAVL